MLRVVRSILSGWPDRNVGECADDFPLLVQGHMGSRTVLWRPFLMSVLSVPALGEARSLPTWRSMEFRSQ
jgi:hypothetical protein